MLETAQTSETETVDPVGAWRTEQFERLGFDATTAVQLSVESVDWHIAEELRANGCSTRLVAEILL